MKTADAGNKTAGNSDAKNAGTSDTEIVRTPGLAVFEEGKLVGKWIGGAQGGRGAEWRMQFAPDGTFIFSTCRGDGVNDTYKPGMRYGDYSVKRSRTANWLVLKVRHLYFGNGDRTEDKSTGAIMFKAELQDGKLAVVGELLIYAGKKSTVLTRGNYPDMHKTLPPSGRRNIPGEKNKYKFTTKTQASEN